MKWYVDEGLQFPERRRFHDPASCSGIDVIPARDCFVGELLQPHERVDEPEEADFCLVPWLFDVWNPGFSAWHREQVFLQVLRTLPHFEEAPTRHVMFLLGDSCHRPDCCARSAVFMPSCLRGTRAFALPYFAEPPDRTPLPISECPFDVGFQGTITTGLGLRGRLVEALRSSPGARRFTVDCLPTNGYFHATYFWDEHARLKTRFREHLNNCRFIACPRGDGLSSLRFFEALAWGRIPILIADDTALPLDGVIPYHEFVVRVPEGDVANWEAWVEDFLALHPDLERASRLAAETSRRWFTVPTLSRLVADSLSFR
jgi:hypothetical protein